IGGVLALGGSDTLISIENVEGSKLADILIGSGVANVMRGGDGVDYLDGGAGDDVLEGGAGSDSLVGGAGSDTASYQLSTTGVTIDLSANNSYDGVSVDSFSLIENAIGSAQGDSLVGNAGANILEGLAGVDYIYGGAGSDTASYRSSTIGVTVDIGAAYSWDGVSTDFFNSIENAIGSAQGDALVGDGEDNILEGLGGVDFIYGGPGGADTTSYRSSATGVTVDLAAKYSWDGASTDFFNSIENAIGSEQGDALVGDVGDNILEGLGGVDFIYGGAGGSDTTSYRSSLTGVTVDLAAKYSWDGVSTDFFNSIENAIGSEQGDALVGDAGDNTLEGLGGTDFIYGGPGGSDTASYRSSLSGVTIDLAGQTSYDGASVDFFNSIENGTGSALGDVLFGSTGANILEGLAGGDTLIGNGGDDIFRFASAGTGADTITDFDSDPVGGQDLIDLSGRGFTAASLGGAIVISGTTTSVITIGTDTITLNGVASSSISATDFIF
ncbi:MAG: calcium-binding protein, partial [Hyphomicrobiaceae bacterium]|nr:calcium-binding protein [Hyphomicrobiaceae bacterium]